jgi:hypothetical protein
MAAFPGFVGGAYAGANPVSSNQLCINWYPSAVETEGATAPRELLPTPGVKVFATMPKAGGRANWSGEGRTFVIFGDKLYEVDINGVPTERGTVAQDSNPATIVSNGEGGDQLFITSGGNGYCYNLLTNTLTNVISSGSLMGGMVDGFFISFGNAQFRISDLFDGTVWDPTQFAQRSVQPDQWRAMLVDPYGFINLFGDKTAESWVDTGSFPFPFNLDRGLMIEEGIAAPFSLKHAGKRRVWLSANANGGYQVMSAIGSQTQRISTHALELAIKSYSVNTVADAVGETYETEGHSFYQISFLSAKKTWVYDFSTGLWHQRGTWINAENDFTYWRPTFFSFNFGKQLAVDRDNDKIYDVSDKYAIDVDNLPLRRVRQTPATNNENDLLFYDWLEILMQTGVGLSTGSAADVDPQCMLRVSNDFGRTFGAERMTPAGKIGEYSRRVQFWGLGSGRGRVYHFSVSAGVPWRITNAFQRVRG